MRLILLVIFSFLATSEAALAVNINEVAWMGGTTSANHEWIELYNDSTEAVVVDGFVLSDGMNLNIALTGTIAAGAYAVLERSSDESAPGSAFLVYAGALVNTGATLYLRDGGGGTVDQVAGGENWGNIGGDNVTKETAQYTSGGWVTDTPTPGVQNRSGRVEVVDEEQEEVEESENNNETENTSTTVTKSSSSSSKKSPEKPKTPTISAPATVFVHQAVSFKVETGEGGKTIKFDWNFGDGSVATGTAVTHRFKYPGTYLVNFAGRIDGKEVVVEKEVTAIPLALSLGVAPDGAVQLHNDARYDVDVSNYTLYAGRVFKLPPRTKIKAKGTITIPRADLGADAVRIVLDNGQIWPLPVKTEAEVVTKVATEGSLLGAGLAAEVPALLPTLESISIPAPLTAEADSQRSRIPEMVFGLALLALAGFTFWRKPSSVADDRLLVS